MSSSLISKHIPWWLLFILPSFFLLALSDTSCSSSLAVPIVIPVQNVTLANNFLARGAFLSVGSPSQSLAFAPNEKWNNTYVFDASTEKCSDASTPNACAVTLGGFFNEGRSSTYIKSSSRAASGAASETFPDHNNDVYGSDTLELNATISIPHHPIGVQKGPVDHQNALGLGRNSTILNTLFSNGTISSRTYGWWHGWTGAESSQQMDGSLTLGGYDAAKISGSNITLPFTEDNWDCLSGLAVTISDIKMNLRNGSNISVLGASRGSAMKACLAPSYEVMSLSEDIWNAFVNVSEVTPTKVGRSGGVNFWGMLIDAKGAYDGDLTFSLAPGLDIRIPNHQLVVPNYVYSDNGELVIENGTTVREVVINSLQNISKNDMPLLGRPFMTSTYLIVDQDHREFTLAQAKATNSQKYIPIGPPACHSAEPLSTPASTTSTQSSPTISPSTTPPVLSRQGVPTAAIAGGTVGGVVAVAGCLLAWWTLRKRRQSRQQAMQHELEKAKMSNEKSDHSQEAFGVSSKPEMPSDYTHQPAAELPLERNPQYDLAPYEMPSTGGKSHSPQAEYEMPVGITRRNTPHELL